MFKVKKKTYRVSGSLKRADQNTYFCGISPPRWPMDQKIPTGDSSSYTLLAHSATLLIACSINAYSDWHIFKV